MNSQIETANAWRATLLHLLTERVTLSASAPRDLISAGSASSFSSSASTFPCSAWSASTFPCSASTRAASSRWPTSRGAEEKTRSGRRDEGVTAAESSSRSQASSSALDTVQESSGDPRCKKTVIWNCDKAEHCPAMPGPRSLRPTRCVCVAAAAAADIWHPGPPSPEPRRAVREGSAPVRLYAAPGRPRVRPGICKQQAVRVLPIRKGGRAHQ